jgi:hypothetical protein
MNSKIITVMMALLTVSGTFAQKYEANRQKSPITTDGKPTEWTTPLRFSDTKSGLQYNVTNDDENLYICVRATNESTQQQILMSGLKIFIDENGKKKYGTSVQFPVPPSREGMKPGNNMQKQEMPSGQRPSGKQGQQKDNQKKFMNPDPRITLAGFKSEFNGTFPLNDSRAVKAAMDFDNNNILTIEYTIPLSSFFTLDWKSAAKPTVLAMKIYADAVDLQKSGNSQGGGRPEGGTPGGGGGGSRPEGGPPGGGEGGMGGPPGGMDDGGMMPQGGSDNTQQGISIKYKITLNRNK